MATKSKSKPASATPARPAWRYTSAHLPVTGGRAVVYSVGAAYAWKVPGDAAMGYERDFETAQRMAVKAVGSAGMDAEWIYTSAIMELCGAAVRRLSVQLIGDEIQWQAINEGRAAARGSTDFATDARRDAEQWARENGWMCPDRGGPMHQCKTGDAGCFHCDNDKCGGAVAPRRGA